MSTRVSILALGALLMGTMSCLVEFPTRLCDIPEAEDVSESVCLDGSGDVQATGVTFSAWSDELLIQLANRPAIPYDRRTYLFYLEAYNDVVRGTTCRPKEDIVVEEYGFADPGRIAWASVELEPNEAGGISRRTTWSIVQPQSGDRCARFEERDPAVSPWLNNVENWQASQEEAASLVAYGDEFALAMRADLHRDWGRNANDPDWSASPPNFCNADYCAADTPVNCCLRPGGHISEGCNVGHAQVTSMVCVYGCTEAAGGALCISPE